MRGAARQQGAAALEFALVLPVLLLLMYGLVVYSYMFVLQGAITFAAQEAAEAAVKVDPALEADDYETIVRREARDAATRVLSFLPENQQQRVLGSDGSRVDVLIEPSPTGIGGLVTVRLTFDFRDVFPSLALPGLGTVPPLPEQLAARAVVGV